MGSDETQSVQKISCRRKRSMTQSEFYFGWKRPMVLRCGAGAGRKDHYDGCFYFKLMRPIETKDGIKAQSQRGAFGGFGSAFARTQLCTQRASYFH